MIPLPLPSLPNPFDALGDVVGRATADAWTAAMLALWEAGLFLLRIVLAFADMFLTPDLSQGDRAATSTPTRCGSRSRWS